MRWKNIRKEKNIEIKSGQRASSGEKGVLQVWTFPIEGERGTEKTDFQNLDEVLPLRQFNAIAFRIDEMVKDDIHHFNINGMNAGIESIS